jgi:Raf kinase inhibitor-like YbhB/YbcL family protein
MRTLLLTLAAVLLLAAGCSDSDDGDEAPTGPDSSVTTAIAPATSADTAEAAPTTAPAATAASLQFSVEGVTGGSTVPVEFTCDGANETPAVTIEEVPDGVVELALIVDDPDAPTASPFVHWVVYGIGSDTTVITDGDDALAYGVNDAGTDAWFGPCPPPDGGLHTYRWKMFGLSALMDLPSGVDGGTLEAAIADAAVAEALLIASYERAG